MKYKLIIILSIYGMLIPAIAKPQVFERNRSETRSWKASKETSLEVINKYGNIHLFMWEKDSVRIHVNMQIKASKQAKADKIYEYIDFEFTQNKYFIIARTKLNQQGEFWAEVSDLASTFFSSGTKVQIDYSIYLPSDISVKIENKFGNIYTTDHSGKMIVILSNGDFKANDLKGQTDMNISFGNATINTLQKGKISLSYCELDLEKSDNLTMESKSSTLKIDKVKTLNITSKRDKFFINHCEVLSGKASFSYLTIQSLFNSATLSTDYGEANFEGIKSEFGQIDLTSSYTDISLNIPVRSAYATEISHTGATLIKVPVNFTGMKTETIDKKADLYKTSGTAGNGLLKRGKIIINSRSGNITFREAL